MKRLLLAVAVLLLTASGAGAVGAPDEAVRAIVAVGHDLDLSPAFLTYAFTGLEARPGFVFVAAMVLAGDHVVTVIQWARTDDGRSFTRYQLPHSTEFSPWVQSGRCIPTPFGPVCF